MILHGILENIFKSNVRSWNILSQDAWDVGFSYFESTERVHSTTSISLFKQNFDFDFNFLNDYRKQLS